MVKKVVRLNQEWIPTNESGDTLYIRPLLIGTSAQVGSVQRKSIANQPEEAAGVQSEL